MFPGTVKVKCLSDAGLFMDAYAIFLPPYDSYVLALGCLKKTFEDVEHKIEVVFEEYSCDTMIWRMDRSRYCVAPRLQLKEYSCDTLIRYPMVFWSPYIKYIRAYKFH